MPAGERDLRVDFFRGLALLSIVVDHTAGNAFAALTLRGVGVSDAAEVFVFLSGLVCARAYGRLLDERGLGAAWGRALRRALTLYGAHLAALAGALAVAALGLRLGLEIPTLRAAAFLEAPAASVREALALRRMPYALDILPLYMAFLAVLPPMLWLARRSILAMLAVSAGVYALGLSVPGLEPTGSHQGPAWFVNPLAWQLLFFLGVAIGADARAGARERPPLALLALAGPLVVLGSAGQIAETLSAHGLLPLAVDMDAVPFTDKRQLGVLRLAWFLAAVALIATLLPARLGLWRAALLRPVLRCGRHALPVYAVGVSVSWAGSLVLAAWPGRLGVDAAVSLAACALLVGTARLSEALDARRPPRREGSAAAPPGPAPGDRSRSRDPRDPRRSWASRSRPAR